MNMENVVWKEVEQAEDFFVFLPSHPLPLQQTVLEMFYIVGLACNIASATGPLRQFC